MGVFWFYFFFIIFDFFDGMVLFIFEFQVVGCGILDIQFFGLLILGIELFNGSFINVSFNFENVIVIVSGGNCGIVIFEIIFSINNIMLDVGEIGCLEVEVQDFENIIDVVFSIIYNVSLLNFSLVGGFSLVGLDVSDFIIIIFGVIIFDWFNVIGIFLIDGVVIFELCFIGVQVGIVNFVFFDNFVVIVVINGDGENVDFIG